MNSRYWIIISAIILLVFVAVALVWSQTRQMQKSEEQVNSTENITLTPSEGQFELKILSPTNGSVVNNSQLLVSGKTKPNAELFINDKDTTADSNGSFSTTLTIDEGENLIIVTANDADGNIAEDELVVTYDAEE